MESNGFPMCIHVSSATQKLLHNVGEWQYFGCREIKGSTPRPHPFSPVSISSTP